MLNVLIPCAGEGKRFKEAGYKEPKPLIDVNGKPMIQRAIESLLKGVTTDISLVVVSLFDHKIPFLDIGDYSVTMRELFSPTKGALCSCLEARKMINNNTSLVIANCDQIIEGGWGDLCTRNADGAILTMRGDGTKKWSYASVEDGKVTRVVEKVPYSDRATCGVYWFARGKDFVQAADRMIANHATVNGEYYVAPVYNYLIEDGLRIEEVQIESYGGIFHGLGTPEDLEAYLGENRCPPHC